MEVYVERKYGNVISSLLVLFMKRGLDTSLFRRRMRVWG